MKLLNKYFLLLPGQILNKCHCHHFISIRIFLASFQLRLFFISSPWSAFSIRLVTSCACDWSTLKVVISGDLFSLNKYYKVIQKIRAVLTKSTGPESGGKGYRAFLWVSYIKYRKYQSWGDSAQDAKNKAFHPLSLLSQTHHTLFSPWQEVSSLCWLTE